MSFRLPESSLNISQVTLACLDIDLIETRVYAECLHISWVFPEGLDCGMEVLSNRIWASVPKPYFFDEVEAERVIGKWESAVKDGEHVGVMHA